MAANILVATPHAAFGELLRLSLEDSGQYVVRLVQSVKEARAASNLAVKSNTPYHLTIVDSALADAPYLALCAELLEQHPGIRLMVIPPENNPNHPALGGLLPHGYLSRPFYLPDLLENVSRLIADRESYFHRENGRASAPGGTAVNTLPPWLQEPLSLHNYREKELPKSQALAALAGVNGPQAGTGLLRASAGALDEASAQELSSVVFRYWNGSEKTDLMRFIRLSAEKKDYLIYATQVIGDLVLILVFDTAAPLSLIRPQTKTMAQTIVSTPLSESGQIATTASAPAEAAVEKLAPAEAPQAPSQAPSPTPVPDLADQAQTTEWYLDDSDLSESDQTDFADDEEDNQPLDDDLFLSRVRSSFPTAVDEPQVETTATEPEPQEISNHLTETETANSEEEEFEQEGDMINLSALLGSIPPPDPGSDDLLGAVPNSGWMPERFSGRPIPTLPGGLNGVGKNGEHPFEPIQPETRESLAQAGNTTAEPAKPQAGQVEETAPYTIHPVETSEPAAAGTVTAGDEQQSNPGQPAGSPAQTTPVNSARGRATGELHSTESEPAPSLPVDYSLPAVPQRRLASEDVNTEPPRLPISIPAPQPVVFDPETSPSAAAEAPIQPVDDTRPRVVNTVNQLNQFEPASPALSLLNYTCVLVPRLPQHYLTGELADRLGSWMHQLCLAFGWRLEGISIRPEYLQWSVQVAPAVSPGNLVKIIRQRTSLNIFSAFPHFAEMNPSGDYWATGYLIVSGSQPPSAQLLRDYILQTRKRQGINK